MINRKESIDAVETKYKNRNNEDVWVITNAFPIYWKDCYFK